MSNSVTPGNSWSQPISILGPLSKRTLGILEENDIKTVGNLVVMSEFDFLRLRNASQGSLNEIKKALKKIGETFS